MKVLVVITKAGLCNRLQEMLSYFEHSKEVQFDKTYFIWTITEHLHSDVKELFHLPGVTILENSQNIKDNLDKFIFDNIPKNKSHYGGDKLTLTYNDSNIDITIHGGTGKHPKYDVIDPKKITFQETLVNEVQNFIDENLKSKFHAIHIRYKDGSPIGFHIDHEMLKDFIQTHHDTPIYVSTDSKEMQEIYRPYSNVVMNSKLGNNFKTIRRDLYNSIFDLLLCSKSTIFIGTPNKNTRSIQSSYSNFIYGLRGVYKEAISREYLNKHFIHDLAL